MELDNGIQGISDMLGSISTVNAVVEYRVTANQMVTLATIPFPAPSN